MLTTKDVKVVSILKGNFMKKIYQINNFEDENIIDFNNKNSGIFEQEMFKFSFFNLVFKIFRI